jgi:hypothetical protein
MFCALMLAGPLRADWKIVTRTASGRSTEYWKGSRVRQEPVPGYITVLDYGGRRQVNWRSDLRQYAIVEWPVQPPTNAANGPVIRIERSTRDTGERKQILGRAARHLITTLTRSDGPESLIDAWYVDAAGLPDWKTGSGGSFAVLSVSAASPGSGPPRIEVKQSGPPTEGLVVWQKMKSANFEYVSEVTELVERPLPDSLFAPPDGYQQVSSLSYPTAHPAPHTVGEMLQAHWRMFEEWVSNLFGSGTSR